MIRKERNGVQWLEFELLAEKPNVVHGVFLRHGGVSSGPYGSLNVGGGTGDDPAAIKENRRRVQSSLGLEQLVSIHQVHGNCVEFTRVPHFPIHPCDGVITDRQGLGLLIKHADCQAAIFYDPILKVVGNVHSGWRGNVHNIYHNMVLKMGEQCGCRPENLLVCVSPSLGPERSEFIHYRDELPESFWPFQIKPTYFDLWSIARMQLEEAGVLPSHIEIATLCTYEGRDDFFSYRRDKIIGNNATVISLM